MSKIWPHYTRENPCPYCQKWGWTCRYSERAAICMRTPSSRPMKCGGWLHFFTDEKPRPIILPQRPVKQAATIDFARLMACFPVMRTEELANELGVTQEAVNQMGAAWDGNRGAWAIPMRDGDGSIIGINLRYPDGSKKAITGSRLGLFIPKPLVTLMEFGETVKMSRDDLFIITEGASDVAALLTMGFSGAIGRPSCSYGGDMLKVALKRLGVGRVVIAGENDSVKSNGLRPGIEGAMKLKRELGMASVCWLPPSPCKDVRDFIKRGGSARMIRDSVNQKIWTKV